MEALHPVDTTIRKGHTEPEENQGMYSTRVTGCLPPSLVELHALEEPVLQIVASQVVEQIVALELLLRWLRAPGSCT